MLEWTDDLEGYILKGYGKSVNYRMGMPLLEDVVQSMEHAIKAEQGTLDFSTFEFLAFISFNETSNIYVWISLLR